MKSLIRRQVRKHSPELANLDNKRRRISGQARRYKGKVNRYGRDIKMPKGFKAVQANQGRRASRRRGRK